MILKNRAQNLLEYTLVLAIVTLAVITMQTYFKRGIQSMVKATADDYGSQGDVVGETEMEIKRQVYTGNTVLMHSTANAVWNQKIENLGNSNARTELSGSNTITGNSLWVGGDYRTRRLTETQSQPTKVE